MNQIEQCRRYSQNSSMTLEEVAATTIANISAGRKGAFQLECEAATAAVNAANGTTQSAADEKAARFAAIVATVDLLEADR